MESIVIVGCGELGGLVFEFLSHDPLYQVAGFAVEHQYLNESTCCGRPVVDLDKLPELYPSDRHHLFVAIYSNAERKRVFLKCRDMGYHFLTYKSPSAAVSPSAKLGENVIIMENSKSADRHLKHTKSFTPEFHKLTCRKRYHFIRLMLILILIIEKTEIPA